MLEPSCDSIVTIQEHTGITNYINVFAKEGMQTMNLDLGEHFPQNVCLTAKFPKEICWIRLYIREHGKTCFNKFQLWLTGSPKGCDSIVPHTGTYWNHMCRFSQEIC